MNDTLDDAKITKQRIRECVESEGLEDAIMSHIDADTIADLDLARAWRQAEQAIDQVERLLYSTET